MPVQAILWIDTKARPPFRAGQIGHLINSIIGFSDALSFPLVGRSESILIWNR